MLKHRYYPYLGAMASGLGIYWSALRLAFWPAWICLVPLFVFADGASPREAGRLGLVTGLVVSFAGFAWMIDGAETFTGRSTWYGIAVFAVCTLLFSGYWYVLLYLLARIKPPPNARKSGLLTCLLAGALWVCGEAGLQALTRGMPWFQFHTGSGLAGNLWAIQPVSAGGIHAATFAVVGVNCGLARCLRRGQWKRMAWPALAVLLYMTAGWGMLRSFDGRDRAAFRPFSLSILSENIPPSIQWDSLSGDSLAGRLLNLARRAAAGRADAALWSESAVPWTYRPDDDLVREICRITDPAGTTHFLGMNTAFSEGVVYNSAYCLLPGGKVAGRYDKQVLLSAIEEPWHGWLIPFFSSNGYSVEPGSGEGPLPTPFGPAGVLICNESTVSSLASREVREGARFFLNLSNDGWFSDTYLAGLHFCNARLRAVENRRDIAVNSNEGISGLVSASGRIVASRRGDTAFLSTVLVQPRTGMTLAARCPLLPVWLSGLCILACALRRYGRMVPPSSPTK